MGLDKFKQASNRSWTHSKIFFRHDLNEDSNICLNDDVRRPCPYHTPSLCQPMPLPKKPRPETPPKT